MKKLFLVVLFLPIFLEAQKQITFDDVYRKGTFRSEFIAGFNSMKDGRFYTELTAKGLVKKKFENNDEVEVLIKTEDVKDENGELLSFDDFEFSEDEKKILIFKNRESIYRRSSKAMVYVLDVITKKTILVDKSKILHATFSPDATKVAYVKDNNLFYFNLLNNKTIKVTSDGKWNNIINGNCDWVYEEEFEFTRAFEWSSNSNFLAYYRFDESKVPLYQFPIFDSLYPTQYSYKYPKAGDANSSIDIFIYNTSNSKKVKVDIGKEKDIYIPRIKWIGNTNNLCVYWMNRLQNNLKLLSANANTGKSSIFYNETNKFYIEINDNMHFLKDGDRFIFTSERDGLNTLYLGSIKNNTVTRLFENKNEVAELYGVDDSEENIYFSLAENVRNRMPYVYNLSSKNLKPIRTTEGTHRIEFNKDFTYFVDYFSTATTPTIISLQNTAKCINNNNEVGNILKDNKNLLRKVKEEYDLPFPTFQFIKNRDGVDLCSWMLKPKNFDSSKKYPVLFCNYGGPGSQQVANKWGVASMWHQYLAQQGIIVVCVDNTGTGFRGEAFKKKTYLQLGKYEIEDQIDAAKYLATLPYIDASRIGHWGWSFGGFMSSLAITKGADVFKLAVAVAPVTSWRYYDNIYTERYMQTPQTNKSGYDENAPLNFTKKIKGKFLIIHGTADDNVHFQNATMMVNEMIKNNIEFESGYYPNRNHGIYGDNATYHIYNKMTKFILQNL